MDRSGIFKGKTTLGISGFALGDASVARSCVFATGVYSAGAKALQQELVNKGATKLHVDGLWGPCSESAFEKVTGVSLTKSSLESLFPISCSVWSKAIIGKACSNGTDEITTPQAPPPGPGGTPVPGTQADVPCPANFSRGPDGACYPVVPGPGGEAAPPTVKTQWIAGVPNYAVIGGAVAMLGLVGYLSFKGKKS